MTTPARPESRAEVREAVSHEIDEHPDMACLVRVLARRFGITFEQLRTEIISEVDSIVR